MRNSILLCFLLMISTTTFATPPKLTALIQQVLKSNTPRKNFHYNMKDKERTEYDIKYVGSIKVTGGKTYKVVNLGITSVPVGLATHANAIILLYNSQNKFEGAYYVVDADKLPDHIAQQQLVFIPQKPCTKPTRISFAKEVPQEIFLECTKDGGNIYNLSTDPDFL